MTALPAKTSISDTYPLPSNATARAGFATLWDALNEATQKSELDLASAATCDIGGQLSTKLRITGTTGITSFGTTYRGPVMLRFSGVVAITHNATTLRCPGGASYTTTANEAMAAWPIASVSGTLDGWQLVTLGGGAVSGVAAITSGSITGITDLAIADGGTGASTAATAFSNLKQAASESATGVVELASIAETEAATDTTRVAPVGYLKYHPGVAKAWVAFNGSGTVAIGSSLNVSSVTDNGAGNYTVNFSTAFSNANYAVAGFCTDDNGSGGGVVSRWSSDTKTTAACQIRVSETTAGGAIDSVFISVVFFGDL